MTSANVIDESSVCVCVSTYRGLVRPSRHLSAAAAQQQQQSEPLSRPPSQGRHLPPDDPAMCCRAIFYGNEMGVSLLQCIRGWDWDGWDGEFHDTCTLLKVLMLRRRLT